MRMRLTGPRLLLLILLTLTALAGSAYAASLELTDVFRDTINVYVDALLNSTNDVNTYAWMMVLFLTVLALFFEVCKFMFQGFEPAEHLTTVLMILVTLILWRNYVWFVDMIWQAGDGLGMAFQVVATGYSDPLFLSKWTAKTVARIVIEEFDIWSAGQTIMLGLVWSVVVLIIEFLMYLAAMFAVWGLALSKIIGVIFIPFLAFEPTRKLFDSWLRFFIGFIFLMITLRITSVIGALTIQSQLKQLGMVCSGKLICLPGPVNADAVAVGVHSHSDVLFSMIIAIVFICSSFGFAKQLGAGVGSASTGLGGYAKAAAAKAVKALAL